MSRDFGQLTRWQALALQAVLPILLMGVVLPIGLVALLLEIEGAPISDAVDRGELFLAGGNAAFTGCLVLISARPDKAVFASICTSFASIGVVLPCYAAWALITTAGARHADYSVDAAVKWGLAAAVAGLLLDAVSK